MELASLTDVRIDENSPRFESKFSELDELHSRVTFLKNFRQGFRSSTRNFFILGLFFALLYGTAYLFSLFVWENYATHHPCSAYTDCTRCTAATVPFAKDTFMCVWVTDKCFTVQSSWVPDVTNQLSAGTVSSSSLSISILGISLPLSSLTSQSPSSSFGTIIVSPHSCVGKAVDDAFLRHNSENLFFKLEYGLYVVFALLFLIHPLLVLLTPLSKLDETTDPLTSSDVLGLLTHSLPPKSIMTSYCWKQSGRDTTELPRAIANLFPRHIRWLDIEQLIAGSNVTLRCRDGAASALFVFVAATPAYFASKNCQTEWDEIQKKKDQCFVIDCLQDGDVGEEEAREYRARLQALADDGFVVLPSPWPKATENKPPDAPQLASWVLSQLLQHKRFASLLAVVSPDITDPRWQFLCAFLANQSVLSIPSFVMYLFLAGNILFVALPAVGLSVALFFLAAVEYTYAAQSRPGAGHQSLAMGLMVPFFFAIVVVPSVRVCRAVLHEQRDRARAHGVCSISRHKAPAVEFLVACLYQMGIIGRLVVADVADGKSELGDRLSFLVSLGAVQVVGSASELPAVVSVVELTEARVASLTAPDENSLYWLRSGGEYQSYGQLPEHARTLLANSIVNQGVPKAEDICVRVLAQALGCGEKGVAGGAWQPRAVLPRNTHKRVGTAVLGFLVVVVVLLLMFGPAADYFNTGNRWAAT